MKMGVLMGGLSNERDVSLKSGAAVMASLLHMGIETVGIDMNNNLCAQVKSAEIDLAFIALHGRYGEDGCAQGALEIMGVPYTGARVAASAVAMDKVLSKIIAIDCGAKTADWRVIEKSHKAEDMKALDMKAPVVIKPASAGSSLGVTICKKDEEIPPAIDLALESGDRALVEKYVGGALIAVGIVGDKTLPVIEIEANAGFYDYKSKYTPGGSTYHIPARLSPDTIEKAKRMALKIHRAIGVTGMSRSEFIVDKSGASWFLELNTIPGLTETSLLPKAALSMGISFDDLVLNIISEAL